MLDDIDLLATGYKKSAGDFWDGILEVDTVREDNITLHRIPRVELPEAYPNQFLYDDNGLFLSLITSITGMSTWPWTVATIS